MGGKHGYAYGQHRTTQIVLVKEVARQYTRYWSDDGWTDNSYKAHVFDNQLDAERQREKVGGEVITRLW